MVTKTTMTRPVDDVNHPSHYQSDNGVECIEAIEASMPAEAFEGYCRGNAMKYLWRAGKKGTDTKDTDLRKAMWYIKRILGE